jgi:acyl carrier protein
MSDVRVVCRWPEWQRFRKTLLESGKVDVEKLNEIELTIEVDSLGIVELIMSMEQAYGVECVESPKS